MKWREKGVDERKEKGVDVGGDKRKRGGDWVGMREKCGEFREKIVEMVVAEVAGDGGC